MNATREKQVCIETESWITIYLDPRKAIDRVEVCVIVAAVFMIVLASLSPRRRQTKKIIVIYGVEGVFILSYLLIPYTLGLMGGQVVKSELYPVWAIFFAMLFGGTNSMSALKLDQTNQLMKLYCECLLLMFYVGTVLAIFITAGKSRPYTWFISMALNILLSMKTTEQWGAAQLASKPSSGNGIKWLARYMKREKQLSTSYDPRTMQGYKYAVLIHAGSGGPNGNAITLDKIWSDNIGVLSNTGSPHISRLKDLCLSFSLFHLVVRRYFGYTCLESKLDKTRDLVLDGLLRTDQDYERAFQVIDAELAFLYDFFFTKYAYIMYGREVWCSALSLTLTVVTIGVGTWSVRDVKTQRSIVDDLLVQTNTRDIMVTKIVLGALSIFQLLQIWSYCISDWAKVSFVCKYVTHPSWQGNGLTEKLLVLLGRPHRWLLYWSNNIGQYSVLDSIGSGCRGRLKDLLTSGKASKSLKLTMDVKKAVARAIKISINEHLSNGVSALTRHSMSDLCWACQISDEFTISHSILVWHVATSYCEISENVRCLDENVVHQNQVVATSLSRYCAYLVAFAPTLLPGSAVETEDILAELEGEAKRELQNLVLPREKYRKLRQVGNVVDAIPSADATAGETTSAQLLSKGVMLGKSLERMENHAVRWNLLVDFWAEMIVYVAPSDNLAGHIELLAQGGEFLTHVWALLMHAGILERPTVVAAVP